jgi:hypothetical protein
LYQQVFPEYTIKPLGSCDKVIQSVKSLNEQKEFHNVQSFGLIDRDTRNIEEIKFLNSKNVWVLDVAEIENLFLVEDVVSFVAEYMGKNKDEICLEVKKNATAFFNSQLESQIILHYRRALDRQMAALANFNSKDIKTINSEIDAIYSSIDKNKLLEEIKNIFEKVVAENDFDAVLRLFNMKNLISVSKVCELTGIKNKLEYIKLVISLLKKKDPLGLTIKSSIESKIIRV